MVPGNSTPGVSTFAHIWLSDLEKSRWRLKEGEFTFQATFSVPSLSSDRKVPNNLIPDNTHRPRTPRMGLVWSSGTQNCWHFNDAVALRKFLHLRKWLCSFCSLGRKEWGRSNGRQFFVPLFGANDKGYLLSNPEFIYWMMRQDKLSR